MKYWPATRILNNSALQPEHKLEVLNYQLGISTQTAQACLRAAALEPAYTDMLFMYTVSEPFGRVYISYPTAESWLALEREFFYEGSNGFGFNVARLH